MKKLRKDTLIVLSVTLVFAVTGAGIVINTGLSLVKNSLNREITNVLTELQALTAEAAMTLDHLDKSQGIICDEDYLLFLRQLMFQGRYIKDVGYFEGNQVFCTTSMGVLAEPITLDEKGLSFNDKEMIIKSPLMLFDSDYAAFRMKNQHFFIVTEIREILPEQTKYLGWELIFKDGEKIEHVLGENQLYQLYSRSQQGSLSFSDIVVEQCLDDIPFCMLKRSYPSVHITGIFIVLLVTIAFFAGLLGYILICRFIKSRNSIQQRILRGLGSGSFYPLFQPIIDLRSGDIVGCEVLARFKDKRGPLYPDQFIPLMPELGMSLTFTTQLITTAISLLSDNTSIPKGFKINFNIYPTDINMQNLERFMQASQNNNDFKICFEITEDATFNTPEALENLSTLRRNGFEVAIDDFGTGYANLGQLQNIQFDYLKIDRSFVVALEGNNIKSTLIPTIVSLSEQLDVKLVAEGIETEQQAEVLRNYDACLAQGWLFGKPMSAEQLGKLV